jgi:hypothetical protein
MVSRQGKGSQEGLPLRVSLSAPALPGVVRSFAGVQGAATRWLVN